MYCSVQGRSAAPRPGRRASGTGSIPRQNMLTVNRAEDRPEVVHLPADRGFL